MSRIPSFPWRLLVTGVVAWVLYLLLGLAGWSSFVSNSRGDRFELDVRQLLLFGGWAALLVGLAGWMIAEHERDRVGPAA